MDSIIVFFTRLGKTYKDEYKDKDLVFYVNLDDTLHIAKQRPGKINEGVAVYARGSWINAIRATKISEEDEI